MPDAGFPATVRAAAPKHAPAVARLLSERWGSQAMVSRGARHDLAGCPAMVAEADGRLVGLATYVVSTDEAELLSLDALCEGRGVGSALLDAVVGAAQAAGARRLVLVTSNDNLRALRFYQRRGFRLVALHPGVVDRARLVKPSIPTVGNDGIPVHDELELARDLDAPPNGRGG